MLTEILVVEDNLGDVRLIRELLKEGRVECTLHIVEDGEEALMFLRRDDKYADAPRPDLVLLDLKLPRKDGLEVLGEIKSDPDLRRIPVVVLTSSEAESDVLMAYDSHANAYVVKPGDLKQFVQVAASIGDFWLGTVSLPPR